MAHGYLGDGYGKDGERDPNGSDRGEWREGGNDERGRFMFEGRDRDRASDWRDRNPSDRGFFSRTADEARDWFRQDEHDYRPGSQDRYSDRQQGSERGRFANHQDELYRNWRQQQIDALDRDYDDYCRERQQQFHQDFDSWRRNRQSGSGGSQPSARQTELELSERDELEGNTDPRNEPQATTDPEATATLGTNNTENSMPGRR